MKNLIIFGVGPLAQIAKDYFQDDSEYNVVAFTLDSDYIEDRIFEEYPVVPFDKIEESYDPLDYEMFIAVGYAQMNKFRESKYNEAKNKGYTLASYISSKCSFLSKEKCGDNCFIFEDNTIQPYVEIGDNVILWSGNHIGHHTVVKDHNFISSHVVISGHCTIEANCFLGVNATVGDKIIIAKGSLLGAGVVISKDTEENGVYVAPRAIKLEKSSEQIEL